MFQYYWPPSVLRAATIEAFVEAFRIVGYENCESGDLEVGFEKVAIYSQADGTPTHAARQIPDGTWTSKLGQEVDIGHTELHGVSGEVYGEPVVFLKRSILATSVSGI